VGATPLTLHLPPGQLASLVFRKRGYQPMTRVVRLDRAERDLSVKLVVRGSGIDPFLGAHPTKRDLMRPIKPP
jgi:hypothetical protein